MASKTLPIRDELSYALSLVKHCARIKALTADALQRAWDRDNMAQNRLDDARLRVERLQAAHPVSKEG